MATGDQTDMLGRAEGTLPGGWFPGTAAGASGSATPVLDGALAGPAWAWAWLYGLLAYVGLQHRIATATDSNLDLIGADYFGTGLIRRLGETDAAYRNRILANLLAPRGTRAAVIAVLKALTGHTATVFEPARPADTGGWGDIAANVLNTGLAYNTGPGGYGDLALPAQFFVTIQRPTGGGIANVSGWGSGAGGWGVGAIEYGNMSQITNEVLDSDIYAAVNLSRPAGVTAWVGITGTSNARLDATFVLDTSTLS